MPNSSPYYPDKPLTYGQLYFFIKQRVFSINPFDKTAIAEGKRSILTEARKTSPTYKLFIKAATKATGLSEKTVKNIIYNPKDRHAD